MIQCSLTECEISAGGRCLEGHARDCPHLIGISSSALDSVSLSNGDGNEADPPADTFEPLYSGLPLEIDDAREITGRRRAIVVVLTGMKESGKTSLIARVHQLFLSGPVGGFSFAGSRTLPRFEELSWKATVDSGVSAPTMDRSSRSFDNSFLHFAVREDGTSLDPVDLLLNDISGETFPETITSQPVCVGLLCIHRADHVAVIVDGAAMADPDLRDDHMKKARNFVQRVLQTEQIGRATVLHLIITKLDELTKSTDLDDTLAAALSLETSFFTMFSARVASVRCWRLAARPLDGSLPTESIIAELFCTWVSSTSRYAHVCQERFTSNEGRAFCGFRYPGD